MNEDRILKHLNAYRRTVICFYGIAAVLAVFVVVLLFVRREMALPVLMALLLYYIFVVLPADKRYDKSFIQQNLLLSASRVLQNATIAEHEVISQKDLQGAAMFPAPPGEKCALTKAAVEGENGFVAEIVSFYQVPKCVDRRGVSLLRGILVALDAAAAENWDLVYCDSGIFPADVEQQFYTTQGLDLLPLPPCFRSQGSAFGTAGSEEFFHKYQQKLEALLKTVHEQSGRALLRVHNHRIYLLHEGKTLQMTVPLGGIPPRSALESNRIRELDDMMQLCEA